MKSHAIDMTGQRFGAVSAIKQSGRASSGDLKWIFNCGCGKEFAATGYSVRSGNVTSCPACSAERTRLVSLKHGLTETPEFEVWTGMHTRCYNENNKSFKSHGGRGIVICDRWRESFENFLHDMGQRPSVKHSIDRRDNDGNYEPSNCRWATSTEQNSNKRNNVNVTICGVTKILSAWAREYGVQITTASLRHKSGLRGESIFKTTTTTLTHNGITDTVLGWSNRTGIKPTTISMRIRYQWSIQKTLTQGALL